MDCFLENFIFSSIKFYIWLCIYSLEAGRGLTWEQWAWNISMGAFLVFSTHTAKHELYWDGFLMIA